MKFRPGYVALLLLPALAACSGSAPISNANDVTRAVYRDDVKSVIASMDANLSSKITRASVGVISDKMHALGTYNGLTELATDPSKHEYTYRANFTKGSMNIVVRTDPDGKLAAYRIYPTTP